MVNIEDDGFGRTVHDPKSEAVYPTPSPALADAQRRLRERAE